MAPEDADEIHDQANASVHTPYEDHPADQGDENVKLPKAVVCDVNEFHERTLLR